MPGLALIAIGLSSRPAIGLVIPGSIATVTGLVLLVQSSFNLWAPGPTWGADLFPGSIGLGVIIVGLVRGDRKQIADDNRITLVGLILFPWRSVVPGWAHLSGFGFGTVTGVLFPALLIAAGVLPVAYKLWPQR